MSHHYPFGRHTHTDFITLNTRLCKACWACVDNCPRQVINKVQLFNHQHAHIRAKERCRGCLRCVRVCPNASISPIERQNENELIHILG
jgi:Pyruvate/2-oxoacid:ferredoxin oxidoreductase delta subunit